MVSVLLMCCIAMTFLGAGFVVPKECSELEISPHVLEVNAFFSGGRVTVSGRIPSSDDAVVEITGPETVSSYDVKGRVGPFWMTREKISLEKAACLYIVLLPTGKDWVEKIKDFGMGLEHLKNVISINNGNRISDDIFRMFIDLKNSEGLYCEKPGAVLYKDAKNGFKDFTAAYTFSSSIMGGEYKVKVTTIEKGAPGYIMTGEFKVKEIGFIKFVHDLASKKSLSYGVLSVLIALFAGALMGLLFKRGAGSH
jgi:hypothetical protein